MDPDNYTTANRISNKLTSTLMQSKLDSYQVQTIYRVATTTVYRNRL